MGTANNELLAKLHAAISGWTAEVGTAQQHVSQQIAGANSQLERLLTVLHERNGHVAELAKADSQIVHLKQALENAAVPPGTLTHYTPQSAPPIERVRQELDTTVDRLNGAVHGWTNEVTATQKDLAAQFATANTQLSRLVALLAGGDGGRPGENDEALAQAQHERDILSAEVQALNIELEALRHDQESFAEENLNSEVQRDLRQRQELEALRQALAERDTFVDECQELLQDSQRIESGLNEEIETLTREVKALRAAPPSPQEAGADVQSGADREALHSELEALTEKQAALETTLSEAQETIARLQSEAANKDTEAPEAVSEDALREAQERIAQLESERDDALAQIEEVGALRNQVDELTEIRDASAATLEELAALRETRAHLESALAESQETIDRLQAAAANDDAPEKDTPTANTTPDAEVLEELDALRTQVRDLTEAQDGATADANALLDSRDSVAQLEQELDDALSRIIELEARLETSEAEDPVTTPGISQVAHEGIEGAVAALEEELALLQRREEESLASARTLLQELETHRSFEAAQETSLSMARSEIDDLRVTLDDKNVQLQALEREKRMALEGAQEEAEMLRAALEEQAQAPQVDVESEAERRDSGQAQITALTEEIDALKAQLSEREAEMLAADSALEEARGALESLKSEQATAEQEFRKSQETAEKWIDDLDKQLSASKVALEELRKTHEELESRYDTVTGELESMGSADRERSDALDAARAETAEARERFASAEATVAELQSELAQAMTDSDAHMATQSELEQLLSERQQAVESLESEVTRLQEELAEARDALDKKEAAIAEWEERCQAQEQQLNELALHGQGLVVERDLLTATLAEISEKSATQEANLTEALSTLESQQLALQERDAQIETFRHNVSDMTAQMSTLSEEEQEAKRQADQLKEALDTIQASDAQHVDELEQSRQLLEQMRTEHLQQQETANQLAHRGDELEALLKEAQREEISTLATVEELQSQVHTLEEKEAAESQALEETRSQVSAHQETLRDREQRVAQLKARLTEVLEEKEALHVRTAEQEAAIQATMAEVSQIVTERDELRDALEKTKEEKGRIYVGEAGAGLSADEAAMSREQRARQQEILLSELTQYDGNRSLGDILADARVISRDQLKNALEIQAKDPSQLLGTILIEQDMTTDDAIAQAVACQLGKSVVNPMEVHIQPNAIAALNGDICTWHVCIPLRITADRLVVAMANPLDESAIYKLRDVSQREITPVVGAASQIMNAIEAHYGTF